MINKIVILITMNANQGKISGFDQVTFSPTTPDSEPTKKDLRMVVATEQELADVTSVVLPCSSSQDSSTDILPEGALGVMTALGRTVKMWWV